MAKGVTKDISIHVSNKDQLNDLINIISDSLPQVDIFLEYKLGSVKIKVIGEKYSTKNAIYRIKEISKMFMDSHNLDIHGFYHHHLSFLQKTGSKIVSLSLIASILSKQGYYAEVLDQILKTNATLTDVSQIIDNTFEIMRDMSPTIRGKTLKKVIVAVSYLTDYDSDFVLEQGLKMGVMRDYKGKILITMDPEESIKKMVSTLSSKAIKKEYLEYKLEGNNLYFGGSIDFKDN